MTFANASSAVNTRIPRRGIGTLALMLAALLWSAAAMAVEEPAYTVVDRAGQFEIRDYHGYVVAETVVEGTFDGVGSEGFKRLFAYISGGNVSAEKITMTAPVEQQVASTKIAMTAPVEQQRAGDRWRIAFVLPSSYTLAATAPRPTDERVVLADVRPRRMAVVRYRGTWSEARYGEELGALKNFVRDRGLKAVGEPVFARYDPPFMPWFLRRNEIQIEVERLGVANSLSNPGAVPIQQGDYAVARVLYEESQEIPLRLGNRWGVTAALEAIAA